MARTGRRPGNQSTREAILTSARTMFAERGFDGASIRAIASDAEVDPALVHHYFGTKNKLFLAAMEAPADPMEILPGVLDGDPDQLGERIVRAVLTVWESPAGRATAALLRSAVQQEWTARLLRDFLMTQIVRKATSGMGFPPSEANARGSLVVSQILGIVMTRYLLRIEPFASADPEDIVAIYAPNIQRLLTMELPEGFPSPGKRR